MDIEERNASDSSTSSIQYQSSPMEVEETISENPSPAILLRKLNPQHKNRLFSQIWKSKDVRHEVASLFNDYEVNKDKFIHNLIQLFIDISAYQYINVENYVKHNDLKDIVTYMEKSKNSILLTTGKYIVKMENKKSNCNKLGDFLTAFIMISAKERILYDASINIIFQIVEKMSESKLRPIKHTGVFIGLKLLTGLISVSKMIGQKLETYQYALQNEEDSAQKRIYKHKLEKFLANSNAVNKLTEFINWKVFKKNWNHGDSQLHFMRIDCIVEVKNWIEIFPDRFLNNNSVDCLIQSVTDNHFSVRLTAINLLNNILKEHHEEMKDTIKKKIIIEISKRINDINFKVAINAVETLTSINGYLGLPHTTRDEICKLIYYPHFPLAAAAGKFLLQRIKKYMQNPDDKEESLKMLVYFEKNGIKVGIKDKYPFMIETIIDTYEVLEDIPVYLSLLEKSKTNDETITIIINILTESVYQTFLGTCSLIRPKQIKRKVDPDKVEKMTKELIKSLNKFVELVPSLDTLTLLLSLIKDYGMKSCDGSAKRTSSAKK